MRFIDQFRVILLDMMDTFMFGGDRFQESENFGVTYCELGGNVLNPDQVQHIILNVFRRMNIDYHDPSYYDAFPPVRHYLEEMPEVKSLPARELALLEEVFAFHEVGSVPDAYVDVLHRLSETHKLGLVGNIWAKSERFFKELERTGIRHLFKVIVFSSDYGMMKPSPRLFLEALSSTLSIFPDAMPRRGIAKARVRITTGAAKPHLLTINKV